MRCTKVVIVLSLPFLLSFSYFCLSQHKENTLKVKKGILNYSYVLISGIVSLSVAQTLSNSREPISLTKPTSQILILDRNPIRLLFLTMKSIATCYSERAIKISDTYCSGPKPCLSQNLIPSVQNCVKCVYRSRVRNEDDQILTSLTWTNNLMGKGFNIQIVNKSGTGSDQLRKSKGSSTIAVHQSSSSIFEVKWDLSGAEYDNRPEPRSNFYVMVSMNSKPILLLGDYEEHSMSPGYATFWPVARTESFSGYAVYSTKAQFCHTGIAHDIVIKCGREEDGLKDPILTVLVDRKRVVMAEKVQWNFRQTNCGSHDLKLKLKLS